MSEWVSQLNCVSLYFIVLYSVMMQLILPGWTVVPFHYLHEEVAIGTRHDATLVFDVRAQFRF